LEAIALGTEDDDRDIMPTQILLKPEALIERDERGELAGRHSEEITVGEIGPAFLMDRARLVAG
jgi:hypothetical protein